MPLDAPCSGLMQCLHACAEAPPTPPLRGSPEPGTLSCEPWLLWLPWTQLYVLRESAQQLEQPAGLHLDSSSPALWPEALKIVSATHRVLICTFVVVCPFFQELQGCFFCSLMSSVLKIIVPHILSVFLVVLGRMINLAPVTPLAEVAHEILLCF